MGTTSGAKQIPNWQIIFLLLWPGMYFINAVCPWCLGLTWHKDHHYWLPAFVSISVLSWASVIIALFFLKKDGLSVKDIGYAISAKRTIFLVIVWFLIGFIVCFSTRHATADRSADSSDLMFPWTTGERIFWIFTSFSAGFCEEFFYRGFGITALLSKGMNKWLTLFITSVSFTLIHSFSAISSVGMFLFYFIFGVLLGALFIDKKNLWLNMAIHMTYDLLMVFLIHG
jgi:membrane protease YdiL (CAAX protease family)